MGRSSLLPALVAAIALTYATASNSSDPGTPADRAALFDYLLAKTREREAFSPIKNQKLGLDVSADMQRIRAELIAADTDAKLYYALAKTSNARRDRHLSIGLVEGGIRLSGASEAERSNYPVPESVIPHAPVRFAPDYGSSSPAEFFVADVPRGTDANDRPSIGDRLISVNGMDIDTYVDSVAPYHRSSTPEALRWQIAYWLPQRSVMLPPDFYRDTYVIELERPNRDRYTLTLGYQKPSAISWSGVGDQRYPGFSLVDETPTYDLYLADDGPIILLRWYGFRETLVADVDHLVAWAQANGRLSNDIIFDGTRSRGGSLGAYAIQHLSPRSFRTTFGNLRISDITTALVDRLGRNAREDQLQGAPAPLIDDGTWLRAWLDTDVHHAIASDAEYTNDVPFKLAHAPKDSDGVLRAASVHFTGRLVMFLGPYGGSHLDQFAAIVADNDLGHIIGMPAAGYSNTWEWEETLRFASTGKPVVSFMWSVGQTIRPNGEALEGNPAAVDEYVPLTRDNYVTYYDSLMARARTHLGR